jgi:tripartite-type tricarboxylate transporter receptor subunit TctC
MTRSRCERLRAPPGWLVVALLAMTIGAPEALAQSYPNKPIRVVLPFPPGGGTDALARILAPKLNDSLGQPLVIDNRPGATGNIAAEIVAKAPPDGYTLAFTFANILTVNRSLYPRIAFDSLKDFAPITQLGTAQFVLVVHPSVAAKSVGELIALAKAKPRSLNYASSGPGGPLHLAAELFKLRADVDIVHIAYKGGGPAATAVLAGEVQILFGSVASTIPHVKSGRLRALATTGLKRSALVPDLPTLDESGFPGFNVTGWDAILAPAGTPRAIVNRLHTETVKALQLNEVRTAFNNVGYEVTGTTPEQLTEIIRRESAMWAKLVKEADIRAD